jgi:hypothetical protein
VMSAALADCGLTPDIVPAHPKMAALVRTAAGTAASVLARKRRTAALWPASPVKPPDASSLREKNN